MHRHTCASQSCGILGRRCKSAGGERARWHKHCTSAPAQLPLVFQCGPSGLRLHASVARLSWCERVSVTSPERWQLVCMPVAASYCRTQNLLRSVSTNRRSVDSRCTTHVTCKQRNGGGRAKRTAGRNSWRAAMRPNKGTSSVGCAPRRATRLIKAGKRDTTPRCALADRRASAGGTQGESSSCEGKASCVKQQLRGKRARP